MLAWNAELVRLTLFTLGEIRPQETTDLWEEFVGQPPETDTFASRQNQRHQAGSLDDRTVLELRLQSNRVDWHLKPVADFPSPQVPNLGPFNSALNKALNPFNVWIPKTPMQFWRLALGIVLLAPVETRRSGYEIITKIAPSIRFNPADELGDFSYQINRPKTSNVIPNLKINRLMRWRVALFRNINVSIESPENKNETSEYYCRVELDLNTAASPPPRDPLDSDQIPAIFDELAKMVGDIAAKGELA